MLGSLSWLRKQSISQAARSLASTLGDRLYMQESAPKFLARCYDLRSQLVHGHEQMPAFDEVNQRGAELERMVGDLIGISIISRIEIGSQTTFTGAHPADDWDGDPTNIPLEAH